MRGDVIEAYKYVHKLQENPGNILKLEVNKTHNTRGHSLKLSKEHCFTRIRTAAFGQRTINLWNSLPEYVVTSRNLTQFKSAVDKLWENRRFVTRTDDYY